MGAHLQVGDLQPLEQTDVLIWWGHKRQAEVKPEVGKKLVERIKAGSLSLIALHSAHWSTPFVEAMDERTRRDAERAPRDSAAISWASRGNRSVGLVPLGVALVCFELANRGKWAPLDL